MMADPTALPPTRRREGLHAAWDGFILVLVCANLALILFDSLYSIGPLNRLVELASPTAHGWYAHYVHAHFQIIDLCFVAFFILDVLLGWAIAIAERCHGKWWYYPFIHWYDVLGCIPLSGFRLLRALRVASLLIRLQRLGLIDIRHWRLYEFLNHYYQLLMEEISDRVMIKIFGEIQEELRTQDDFSSRVIDDVIRPRKQQLIDAVASRLQRMINESYAHNQATLHRYVSELISSAVAENEDIKSLKRLPMGDRLAKSLDNTLADIVNRLIREAVVGLQSRDFKALASRIADRSFDESLPRGQTDLDEVLVEILEVFKQKVIARRASELGELLLPTPLADSSQLTGPDRPR
ncbi:ion transporter [Pseudomonas luteola]|uniref:ion transporter n=1 Tax=Pseudomonas luteola TaxID=47886 RepID=UPI003A842D88